MSIGIAMLPELVHHLTQRTVLEAKFISNVLLRSSVDEDRSQRFVPPMISLSWLCEVPLISRIVHDWASVKMSVDYWNS